MLDFNIVTIALLIAIPPALTLAIAIWLREVVETNMVHVVQSRKKTISYGVGESGGNVYYRWPHWVPRLGVTVIELPVSNFDLSLLDYEAYDKERVPFMVDVVSFFRINDTTKAARRVSSIQELSDQLQKIVQGAVRKVLASDEIDSIMLERSKFGDQFTAEVVEQLKEWGVESVKAMELMDIRDAGKSHVIENIMAKRTSFIEMESRTEVAKNRKAAETAEIGAQQEIDVRQQEAEKIVGERTAEKDKVVGIATEQSRQEVLVQETVTQERHMDVRRVEEVRTAEIERDKEVVAAQQDKQTTIIVAEGQLEAQKKEAEGIQVTGAANAEAEKAMQLAPVQAQITLAKEIGENPNYMQYLLGVESVGAYRMVGTEQAQALQDADVKVIANSGQPTEGVSSVMDLFTSKGGTNLAAGVEAFAQSPMGEALLKRLGVSAEETTEIIEKQLPVVREDLTGTQEADSTASPDKDPSQNLEQ